MKAILLAAGFATRMYPLTRSHAKPLLDVAGEAIATHILRRVEAVDDVSAAVVVTNHRHHDAFARWASSTRFRFPVSLVDDGAMEDDRRLGAVRDMELAWERAGDDDVLVIAGDTLVDIDLGAPAQVFRENARPLVLVRDVDARGARPYNDVEVDAEGRVTAFREKPRESTAALAAICLYFFPAGVRTLLSRYLEEGGHGDSPGCFIEWLVQRARVDAARFSGRWFDIGSIEGLAIARQQWSRA
jgi:glucose-1-phosphate thymidylyltransferase